MLTVIEHSIAVIQKSDKIWPDTCFVFFLLPFKLGIQEYKVRKDEKIRRVVQKET